MVDIESNRQNGQHEPISIFGRAFIRENVTSQVIFWITSLGITAKGLYKLYRVFDPTIQQDSPHSRGVVKYELIYTQLHSISFGLIILHFKFNRSMYLKYLDIYQTIVRSNFGLASNGFKKRCIKINRFFLVFATIYEMLTTSVNHYLSDRPTDFSIVFFVELILMAFALFGYVFSMQFIIECCTYSQSSFKPLNNLLDSLLNKSLPNNMNSIAKSLRLYYSKTVESVRIMDKFLAFAIFVFYLYFTGHCILIVGEILDASRCSIYYTLWMIFRFFGESSYLVLITYHLVCVNQSSTRIFDKVYQLSFSLDSSHSIVTMNEINLFLLRTNRNDVGFTFAGLCMVSPSFVSSLATISLTLGLALPSFIK
uniref:Gustatory receptor n=1 Tax=Tetranychus urticae TaxID=32264 RepID=T1KPJ8_TETUR